MSALTNVWFSRRFTRFLKFYKPFVDSTITRRSKDQHNKLFEKLNNYQPKINHTTEVQPAKFQYTMILYEPDTIITKIFHKGQKLPFHWSSKIKRRIQTKLIKKCNHKWSEQSSTFNSKAKIQIYHVWFAKAQNHRFIMYL